MALLVFNTMGYMQDLARVSLLTVQHVKNDEYFRVFTRVLHRINLQDREK